ncbi:hypothetical protein DFS34DRAFT_610615 [Phlyctochytrium arcticum]|nr:hypothetical protein DFS34DRAFT_610615 [Phlyctochytrium arcticum]
MALLEEILDESPKPGPSRKIQDSAQALDEILKSPFFMRTAPTDKDIEENESLAALHSLIHDGTPEEVATNFKNQGNDCFKAGKSQYKHAYNYYTKGIAQETGDQKLNAVLYVNRAAVSLELGNYRRALNDCAEAIKRDTTNVKAYYRSVKAFAALDKIVEALEFCRRGLEVDPENTALESEQEKLEKRAVVLQKKKEREERAAMEERAREVLLSRHIKSLGINVVSSRMSVSDQSKASFTQLLQPLQGDHKVTIAEDGSFAWPVTFVYPEHAQTDLIASFHEDDTLHDHLQIMFGDERPPWDTASTYVPDNIQVFFEAEKDNEPKRLLRVGNKIPLSAILQHPEYKVVDGMCHFIVLAGKTPFAKTFKQEYKAAKPSSSN